jgi:ATP-dependent Clp protease ATP-binding subunit ClpC
MWQRLTERARRAIFFAQDEAKGDDAVSPEHLLLGVLRDDGSVAARALAQLGIDAGAARDEVRKRVREVESEAEEPPMSPEANQAVDLAYEEARDQKSNWIGTEHILLGVLRCEESAAAHVLREMGATLPQAREAVVKLQAGR